MGPASVVAEAVEHLTLGGAQCGELSLGAGRLAGGNLGDACMLAFAVKRWTHRSSPPNWQNMLVGLLSAKSGTRKATMANLLHYHAPAASSDVW